MEKVKTSKTGTKKKQQRVVLTSWNWQVNIMEFFNELGVQKERLNSP